MCFKASGSNHNGQDRKLQNRTNNEIRGLTAFSLRGELRIAKRDLDLETFNKLLAHFDPDTNRAGEMYESVRNGIIKYFECRGCGPAHELADETIDRAAQRIVEGAPIREGSFSAYFYGVARNVFHEHLRSPDRNQSSIELLPLHKHPSEDPIQSTRRQSEYDELERRLSCLESCIGQLAPEARGMMLTYYQGKERVRINNRKQLAEALGLPINGLRIRVHRHRAKLEACLTHCLAQTA